MALPYPTLPLTLSVKPFHCRIKPPPHSFKLNCKPSSFTPVPPRDMTSPKPNPTDQNPCHPLSR